MKDTPILDSIKSPSDLKKLDPKALEGLSDELRSFLVENVSKTGGHLASNLGIVETTLALMRTFDFPNDNIIFDVGHQSYVYKILTDRKERFNSLRQKGGISGFEKMSESPYDSYGAGHSSTSLSAALGMASASKLQNKDNFTVAIVGDGAFTGGLIHEALDNIKSDLKLVIILNENEMSISKNIGGFAKTISKIRATRGYYGTKKVTRNVISAIPLVGKPIFRFFRHIKRKIKNSLYSSNYFEDLGLYYLGPADGNDIEQIETLIKEAKSYGKACLIHLKTKKGKGYSPAEENPGKYHSVLPKGKADEYCFSEKMGDHLTFLAKTNSKICAISAAMKDGCGLCNFEKAFPDRFFDVGIAEAHAVVFASGLAASGMHPVVPIYSSFLQRSYDSILHDAALQNLPVTIIADRASLSFSDGPTHHGIFDVSFVSGIPNVTIYSPSDYPALEKAMNISISSDSPTLIRYPHSTEYRPEGFYDRYEFIKTDYKDEKDSYVITYGRIVSEAVKGKEILEKEGISCGIILLEKLKPFDKENILSLIGKDSPIVFLEEGIKSGGAGENLYEEIRNDPVMKNRVYTILAINDSFADSITDTPYFIECGISGENVANEIRKEIKK